MEQESSTSTVSHRTAAMLGGTMVQGFHTRFEQLYDQQPLRHGAADLGCHARVMVALVGPSLQHAETLSAAECSYRGPTMMAEVPQGAGIRYCRTQRGSHACRGSGATTAAVASIKKRQC